MYLAIKNAGTHWTMPIKDWVPAVNQFAILLTGVFPFIINLCHLHRIYDRVYIMFDCLMDPQLLLTVLGKN